MPERIVPRYPFAPWNALPEQLVRTFVGRKELLIDLLNRIMSVGNGATSKHSLLVGQRGLGKTHLLCLIHHYVSGHIKPPKEIQDSFKDWISVLFVEEEYATSNTLANFLLYLCKKLNETDTHEELWKLPVDIMDQPDRAIFDCCFEHIQEFSKKRKKKICILIDNLQKIFEDFTVEDQLSLRSFLTDQSTVLLFCTAQGIFKEVLDHSAPFYEYFEMDFIPELTEDEMLLMLKTRFKEDGLENDFKEQEKKLRNNIPGIKKLTGGNPRLILYLYDILLQSTSFIDIELSIRDTIDKLTDYFRSRLGSLASQSRKILDTIAQMEGPATPTEIARFSRLPIQTVNAQIKRLKKWGYIESCKRKKKRSTRYDITDRLFRIWRQTATVAGRRRFKMLTEFLKILYTHKELEQRFHQYKDLLNIEEHKKYIEELYYIQSAVKGEIRYEVFDTGLKAITYLGDYSWAEQEIDYFRKESIKIGDEAGITAAYENQATIHITSEKYTDLIKDIEELFKLDQYQGVLKITETVLKKVPDKVIVWELQGLAAGNLGNHEKALESFKQACTLKPKVAKYWSFQATALINLNRYKEALTCAEKAVEFNLKDELAWLRRGIAAVNLGDYEKGLESFKQASTLNPKEAIYWRSIAALLNNLKRNKEALFYAEKAVKLKPEDELVWKILGIVKFNLGDHEEALESFKQACTLKPKEALYWRLQAGLLNNLKRYKEALSCAEKAVELKPEDEFAWKILGIVESNLDDHEKALKNFQQACKIKPEEAEYWYHQAKELKKLNRYKKALSCINKAIEIDPQAGNNYIQKAWILSELKRIDDALSILNEAKNREANERDVFHAKGDILLIAGRFKEAKKALTNGLKIVPADWDMLVDYEIARACLGEYGIDMKKLVEIILTIKYPVDAPQIILNYILKISAESYNRENKEHGELLLTAGLFFIDWQKNDWYGRELGIYLRKLLDIQPSAFYFAIDKVKEMVKEKDVLDLLNPYIQAVDYARTGDVSILDRLFPEIVEIVLEIADKLNNKGKK